MAGMFANAVDKTNNKCYDFPAIGVVCRGPYYRIFLAQPSLEERENAPLIYMIQIGFLPCVAGPIPTNIQRRSDTDEMRNPVSEDQARYNTMLLACMYANLDGVADLALKCIANPKDILPMQAAAGCVCSSLECTDGC